jgi:hypothetical protein
MIAAGSPGTNRTRKKMKSVIRNSTGTIKARRRRM